MPLPIIPLTIPASLTVPQLVTLRDHALSVAPPAAGDMDRACESLIQGINERIEALGGEP